MNNNTNTYFISKCFQSPLLYFGISAAIIAYMPGDGFNLFLGVMVLVGFLLMIYISEYIFILRNRWRQKKQKAEYEQKIRELAHELALVRKDVENLKLKSALLYSEVEKIRLEMRNVYLSLRCMLLESKLRRNKEYQALPDESNVVEGVTSWVGEDDPRNTMKDRTQEPPSLATGDSVLSGKIENPPLSGRVFTSLEQ